MLADRCSLDGASSVKWARSYAGSERLTWDTFPEAKTATTLEELRVALLPCYPSLDPNRRYTTDDLRRVVEQGQAYVDMDRDDLGVYHRRFRVVSGYLVEKKRLSDLDRSAQYLLGFPQPVRAAIRQRLAIMKPRVQPQDGYEFDDIQEAALFVVTNRDADDGVPPRSSHRSTPSSDEPSMRELMSVLLQVVSAGSSGPTIHPRPRQQQQVRFELPDRAPGVAGRDPPRWDPSSRRPSIQNAPQGCHFCNRIGHFLRECPVAKEYLRIGKVVINEFGKIALPEHDIFLGRDPAGASIQQRVDDFYRNEGIPERHYGASTNFFETDDDFVFSLEVAAQHANSRPPPSSISYDDLVSEIDEKRSQIESLETLALQKRQKERFDGVHVPPRTGPPRQAQPSQSSKDRPTPTILARPPPNQSSSRTNQAPPPAGDQNRQNSRSSNPQNDRPQGPMKPVLFPPKPPVEEKHKYRSAVETTVATHEIVDRALNGNITLSTRELLAVAPDVRRQFKDLVTGKRVATNAIEIEDDPSVNFVDYDSCFQVSEGFPQESVGTAFTRYARPGVQLRVIHPTYAPGVEVESILDSGSQIVVMRRDIWEKTGAPINANKAIRMDAANNTSTMTLGMVENHPVKIGSVTYFLQIHVVANSPFQVLLGRPFFDVANAKEISRSGGGHIIEIQDPETKEHFVFATQERASTKTLACSGQNLRAVNFQG
jgi:hypothetical protein